MAKFHCAIRNFKKNFYQMWDEGMEMSDDRAKEELMQILENYDGFCEVIVTPDKKWTIYYDEDSNLPVCAVSWF